MQLPLRAYTVETERRKAKNGSDYWQSMLKTAKHGTIKSMQFDIPGDAETNAQYPHKDELIEILSLTDNLADYGNVKLRKFRIITKEDLPPEDRAMFEAEKVSPELMGAATDLIGDSSFWVDKKNHKFTMQCLKSVDPEKLKKAPAAKSMHHNLSGGLLVHTAEVLDLCRGHVQGSTHNKFIFPDVLYSAAILHDLGKIETYSFNSIGMPQQLLTDRTIGHTFYSMCIVQQIHEKLKMVSDDFIGEVLHCIAAHHEKREWAAIAEPQSMEAEVLCRMDFISSKIGMIENSLKSIQGSLPETIGMRGKEYFISMGIKKYSETK